jgi:uncharacterized protein
MRKALSLLLAGLFWSSVVMADSAVYEVTKGKQKLFLAGTIHVLRPQDFPLPAEFDAAYRQAQVIVFETDLHKVQTPEFGQRFAQAMLLPDNKTLKDVLAPEVWASLQQYATQNQYPLSQTMMYNPAMTSIMISMGELKKLGVGEGADFFYDKAARADQKTIKGLESEDDVLAYMKVFAAADGNHIIRSTLKDTKEMGGMMETLIGQWRQGDLKSLDKNLGEKMRSETADVYQALVVERNRKWQPQIEAMLTTPEVEMVLVGTLHLSGKDGLIEQLKRAGYKVKPASVRD